MKDGRFWPIVELWCLYRPKNRVQNWRVVCKAFLLCDEVVRDETTHKTSVIGIFDTFTVAAFPGSTSSAMIFLLLASAAGRHSITGEVQDPERGLILFRSPGSGQFGNPEKPTIGEIWPPLGSMVFERPSAAEMVVFADGIEIGRTGFKVIKR